MRLIKRRSTQAIHAQLHSASLALILLSACAVDTSGSESEEYGTSSTPELSEANSPLYGRASYGSDCSPAVVSVIREAHRWGRIASNSSAFAQCLNTAFSNSSLGFGPYMQCNGDPGFNSPLSTQINMALAATRTFTDVRQNCNQSTGNARAAIGQYLHSTPDEFGWNKDWIHKLTASMSSNCIDPANPNCRFAPHPWPYPDLSGIIWHEVAHTNQYQHEEGSFTCGHSSNPNYHFQRNTAPYIIGNCMTLVLNQSANVCGDPLQGCGGGGNALNMVSGLGANSCTCVSDPGWKTIGGAALAITVGGYGVFAVTPGSRNLMQYDELANVWTAIGGPGRQFVANNSALYAISDDGQKVLRYDGTPFQWTVIGNAAAKLIAGGNKLYATSPTTGEILRYDGSPHAWTKIGGAGDQFIANDNDLYARAVGSRNVVRFTGTPGSWTSIGNDSRELIAAGDELYSVAPSGDIYQYFKLTNLWSKVGGPGRKFVAVRGFLYGQAADGLAVYQMPALGSQNWVRVAAGDLTELVGGGQALVARHSSGDLLKLAVPGALR